MKTYVAEVDGQAILVFRAADDEAAQNILCEEDGGFQLVARGYSGLLRADGRPLWDGKSPVRHRAASPEEHAQWLIVRDSRTESADDPTIGSFIWFRSSQSMTPAETARIGELSRPSLAAELRTPQREH
jgi:hypothetical protein